MNHIIEKYTSMNICLKNNKFHVYAAACKFPRYIASYVNTFNLPKYLSIIRHILVNYITQVLGFRFPHNEVILYAKYWIGNRLIG